MKSRRNLAATIAALAVLGLSAAEVTAQPVTSKDNADLSAPEPAPSIQFVLPNATLVESLVGAAESGNVDAMNLLGIFYTTGTQVSRDTSMALYWFQKAIDGGSADAMDNVATMYLFGIGVSRDAVNALRWFVRSAARGNVHSMYSVAVMAEKGLGTARNLQLARAMYRRAAESGFTPAMVRVSDSYARGWAPSATLSKRTHGCRSRCSQVLRRSYRSLRSPAWRISRGVSDRSAGTRRACALRASPRW